MFTIKLKLFYKYLFPKNRLLMGPAYKNKFL